MPTRISWTNEVWNVCTGCTPVSKGCEACYAKRMHNRLRAMGSKKYQHDFSEVRCHPEVIKQFTESCYNSWVNAIGRKSKIKPKPKMIFVNSMSDLFHEDVLDDFLDRVFAGVLYGCFIGHTFQILTKRPKRMMEYFSHPNCWDLILKQFGLPGGVASEMNEAIGRDVFARNFLNENKVSIPNVWLGFSASTQKELDEGLPYLLKTPAAVKFINLEPMLEDMNIIPYIGERAYKCECGWHDTERRLMLLGKEAKCYHCGKYATIYDPAIRQVIVGAESKGAYPGRPCHLEWVRSIRDQCLAAGVPLHIKQLHINGKLVKDISQFPADLQIQDYPEVK